VRARVNNFKLPQIYILNKSLLRLLSGGVIFSGLIFAHIVLDLKGAKYSGPLLFLDHLYNMILVSGLLLTFSALGNYALIRYGLTLDSPIESFLFSTAVGGSLISMAILFLGLLHGFHKLFLFLLFLISILVSRKYLRDSVTSIKNTIYILVENGNFLPLIFFIFASFFMSIRALSPSIDWDTLTVHLRVPYQFLQNGGIYLPEDNLATSLVLLVHMWYVPLLAFGGPAAPALLSTFFALALYLSVFALCKQFLNSATASLCLAVFWGSSIILLVATSPRIDVTLAFFLFLGHYALLRALQNPSSLHFYYLSSVLFGFSMGIKYNAFFYIFAISPLVIQSLILVSNRFAWVLKHFLYFYAIIFIAAIPWLIKNYLLFHSPLYPFLTERQIEPWLNHFYIGDSSVPSFIKFAFAEKIQHLAQSFNLIDWITAPAKLMVEWEGLFYTFNPIFFTLPLFFFIPKNKTIIGLLVPSTIYICLIIILCPFSNLRYLIPGLIPLAIVGAHLTTELLNKTFKTRILKLFSHILVIIIVAIGTIPAMYYWPSNKMSLLYFFGLTSREAFLRDNSMPSKLYADIVFFINDNLTQKDKLLMLFEARGYYFRVPVIQDLEFTNWALLFEKSPSVSKLKSAGISYLLINTSAPKYFQSRHMDLKGFRLDELELFTHRYLVPIYKNEAYVLYALKNS
jgi:hypothetical protein